jgi:hypothetical protein
MPTTPTSESLDEAQGGPFFKPEKRRRGDESFSGKAAEIGDMVL